MNQYAFLLTSYPIGSIRYRILSPAGTLVNLKRKTDPLSGLVVVPHDGSYPIGVVEHPFDEKIYGIKFGEHGKVMPIPEVRRLWIWGQVPHWGNVVVWFVLWLLLGLVLR